MVLISVIDYDDLIGKAKCRLFEKSDNFIVGITHYKKCVVLFS